MVAVLMDECQLYHQFFLPPPCVHTGIPLYLPPPTHVPIIVKIVTPNAAAMW